MDSKLCVELLLTIGLQLSTTDKKALRAASKRLRYVIEPLFCAASTLVLNVADESQSQLEVLAGGTPWSLCRKLNISSLAPGGQGATGVKFTLANHRMHKHLRPALKSLKGLRTLHWTIRDSDDPWAQLVVVEEMNAHSAMHDLRLTDQTDINDQFATLPPFSNLRTLRIQAPGASWSSDSRFLAWTRKLLQKNRHLETLHFASRAGCAEMCQVLEEQQIRLKCVSIEDAPGQLLRYLASYSGLEQLYLNDLGSSQADEFFGSVLPKHEASLTVLRCTADGEGPCFRQQHVPIISKLKRLQMLEMSVNGSDLGSTQKDTNIVNLFLEMAENMPALRNINLLPVIPWSKCGLGHSRAKRGGMDRIEAAMEAFEKERGSDKIRHLIETHRRQADKLRSSFSLLW
ncbi:hypothetical protein DFH06DRAFT_427179 [Mycena polygramma]|nr:hypothetical protein DFH06DRAFT_427179 [Mycena polygramma]